MPYIEKQDRNRIVETDGLKSFGVEKSGSFLHINAEQILKPGELNYAITELALFYLKRKGVSYTNMNEVIGVLECAKLEFYRRATAPYEDKKVEENGDVYD